MGKRRLGALIGAAVLTFAAIGTVSAAPKTYAFTITNTPDPTAVPAGGGDVLYTVVITNTGTGDFNDVVVQDSDVGCSLVESSGHPTGPSDKFASGDTWTYTCTVTGVLPNTTNTADITACHNGGSCGDEAAQKVEHTADAVVGLAAEPTPSDGGGGATNQPTQAPTDMTTAGTTGPSDGGWLLVVALGVLLASLVVLRPAKAVGHRS